MLKVYNYSELQQADLKQLTLRNTDAGNEIRETVENILENVKQKRRSGAKRLCFTI